MISFPKKNRQYGGERFKTLLKKKKTKKQEYGRERCKNLSKTVKQSLFEYRKRYYEI